MYRVTGTAVNLISDVMVWSRDPEDTGQYCGNTAVAGSARPAFGPPSRVPHLLTVARSPAHRRDCAFAGRNFRYGYVFPRARAERRPTRTVKIGTLVAVACSGHVRHRPTTRCTHLARGSDKEARPGSPPASAKTFCGSAVRSSIGSQPLCPTIAGCMSMTHSAIRSPTNTAWSASPGCQSALNIDPLSACNVDPFGDARRRSYR